MTTVNTNKEVILNYISSLDNFEYDKARSYLHEKVKVIGPAGESFADSDSFIKMLSEYKGKYDLRKIFVDGKDVSIFYSYNNGPIKMFMASWYTIESGKIGSVQTIFDSKAVSGAE